LGTSQSNIDVTQTVTDEEIKNSIIINDRFFKLSDDPQVNKELLKLKKFVEREKGHG